MARNTKFYSQAKCSVLVAASDGSWSRTLKDFAEGDDVIAWKPLTDRVTVTEGLDKSGISISSGRAGTVEIKLRPTSPDVGALNKVYNAHRTSPQLVTVSIVSGVEEQVKLVDAAVDTGGGGTGGANMGSVTFTFKGKELTQDESEG
jgi:hypothetical protein